MPLNIKVLNFEGPFDLLLHLIKKNEMDIYDIKIYDITQQYMEYLGTMKQMDLEITSEFIVTAATLIEIKSKMLLPKTKKENESAEEEQDPRKELVNKLVEYKKFKAAAEFLRSKDSGVMYSKKPEVIEEKDFDTKNLFKGITILDLYNIYTKIIELYNSKINDNVIQKKIPLDLYKIEDKMEEIKDNLANKSRLYFSSIVEKCSDKMEIIVTFLALLELVKLKNVNVTQENNFSEIYIERITGNEEY